MNTQVHQALSAPRKAIQLMMEINFVLFLLFLIPFTKHLINRGLWALRPIRLEEPVGRSLQIWLIGSTLIAAILLGIAIFQWHKSALASLPSESLRLEGILVGAWWLIVFGVCAYGFMLGMGG